MNATIFSVLGGVAGYAIGYLTFEAIEPWLSESKYWEPYLTARAWFDAYGTWAIFVAGFSPIPYKVFTIAAGAAALTLPGFFFASLIGRGARFFLVAAFVKYAGVRLEATLIRYIERIGWAVLLVAVIVIAWFMNHG